MGVDNAELNAGLSAGLGGAIVQLPNTNPPKIQPTQLNPEVPIALVP